MHSKHRHIDGKAYFISDAHFGIPNFEESLEREKKLVRWLDEIKSDAKHIFLLGDIFDFWFEYKKVVPRGFVRILGKLAELSDNGIKIYFFIGNHDMWMKDYLKKELGLELFFKEQIFIINGKKVFLGHGDGLGPGDRGYKFIKKIFRNRVCRWLFARLHPNFAYSMAQYFSRKSREAYLEKDNGYLGDEKEFLVLFIKEKLQTEHFDYFIFGHRHLGIEMKIENSTYINTGDWITNFSYAQSEGNRIKLSYYE
ncbi:MAG: UDP-2,3-diacylglucosamine diphosphatase [Bacteroidales bacterium]|nr:UDP-2,3-diacylglucosamine diphosphatase [Bacteroidales bacterium]